VGQPTGLGEDGFWNEVGDMQVTAKWNEKWSHGIHPWDRAEILQTNLTKIINNLVLLHEFPGRSLQLDNTVIHSYSLFCIG